MLLSASQPTEIMSADEVAAWLKVDRKTLYCAAARGEIPHQRLGKRLLFNRAALVSWLAHARSTR
ncbi:MAG TPA: helix-turn-helix domain-containing protein [Kofleriaceae bacterium]|jgi:excisionase family DNA binding protein